MPNYLNSFSVCLFASIVVIASLGAAAEPIASPGQSFGPAPGVLLLKNSQVLEGRIEFSVEHYIVHMSDGEMQVRAADVEFFCRDLEDGYAHKKSIVQPGNVDELMDLARWCEKHRMFKHEVEELDAAEKIDVKNPMIAILRNRLPVVKEQDKPSFARPTSNAKMPSDEDLEQMIRGMPPGAVLQYVNVVQPILLNLCPGAGGSIPGLTPSGKLQLLRPPYGESPNRRITQRNLYAVLQFVNWDNPGASQLLTGMIGGESAAPVRHSTQYQRLEEWVYAIAQKPMPSGNEPAAVSASEPLSIPDLAQQQPRPKRGHSRSAAHTTRNVADPDVDPDAEDAETSASPAKGAQPVIPAGRAVAKPASGATAKSTPGADPFDPAEFNKQAPAAGNMPANALPTPAAKMLGNRQ